MPPLQLRFLGHATFAINLDGQNIITDPVFTQTVTFLKRHSLPVNPNWYQSPDLILVSHAHLDHFHPPSLRKLNRQIPCLVAPGLKTKFMKLGFTKVTELPVSHTYHFKKLTLKAVYAKHQASFLPGTKPISDCIGFLIMGSQTIYFPGDTDFYPQMKHLAKLKIDLCLIPIWGWAIDDHGLHLNPQKAVRALRLIKPKVAIPYHWGTFLPISFKLFFARFLIHPVNLFALEAQKLSPGVKIIILPPGNRFSLPYSPASQ
jgi:L-ascorbate metabolism protein UlaG (beta-lactamase superfamily)